MNNNITPKTWLLVLFSPFGLLVFILLLNKIFPYEAVNFKIDRTEAINIAESFLQTRGYDLDDYHVFAIPQNNEQAFTYLQRKLGLDSAIQITRYDDAKIFAYHWRVRWYKNLPRSAPQQQFIVNVSPEGQIMRFTHSIPDDFVTAAAGLAHLSQDQALKIAAGFLATQQVKLADYRQEEFSSRQLEKRTDHTFRWQKLYDKVDGDLKLTVRVQGNEVNHYRHSFEPPEAEALKLKHEAAAVIYFPTVSLIIFFIILLLLLTIFLKKYHEGEAGVKTAGIYFLLIWAAFSIQELLGFPSQAYGVGLGELSFNNIAIVLIIFFTVILFPLLSLAGFAGWSIGESLAREKWADKLAALDGIINRRLFTLNFARSTLRGYCFGLITLGFIALLAFAGLRLFDGSTNITGYRTQLYGHVLFLTPFLAAISTTLIADVIYRLFANLYIYQHLKRKWIAAIISSIFWSLYAIAFWDNNLNLSPFYIELTLAFIVGILFSYLFWRYDLLTVIMAHFVVIGVMHVVPLITNEAASLYYSGLAGAGLLALPLVFMVIGFIKKETFEYDPDTSPAHIKRITERVRMAQELEIARQVQMKLLPRESPRVLGYDIAGVCIPAKEVGGDYYDFINIGESKLGIAIGDVSGKGVPAAIYMTLTKGIFQSHAEENISPKEVLVKVNHLLYRTIEKESFVSMFYAVLDLDQRKLSYSRAGHNPTIYFHREDNDFRMLQSAGIALGLERGDVFKKIIREQEMQLESGDVLVFYTDGFTEAMNADQDEYGEERFLQVIRRNETESARAIIDAVFSDVKTFVNDYPQHDDMTMVVVKVMG